MSSNRTFRDILCRQFEHFAIHSVDEIINTLFKHQKKINSFESSFFRSSNSIIKEYDLVEENVTKKVFDAQFSIRKKWDDNDFTNHVSISKTMLRLFVWRAVRIFHFESNSWIVCFLFESKAWNEVTSVLVNVFVNQVRFRIELLESFLCYSCVKFSLWFVSFVDIKEFETIHLICSFYRRKKI
jgi:hypothetical protein